MKLSIIMPVYNEIRTLSEIIRKVLNLPVEKELIIVDDFSDDGTHELLRKLNHPSIKVFFHSENRGKAQAIRTGLTRVTGELTAIQDADLEYNPEDYLPMLSEISSGKVEAVYGSRFKGKSGNFSHLHRAGNRFLTFATNLLFKTNLSDMETCYKLFKTDILKTIDICSERFDFEPEVTAKLLRKGIKIAEVPISYEGRKFSEGKKITWRDGFSSLWTLIKYRFLPLKYFCKR